MLLTLGAAGALFVVGFALGMVAHYFWYVHVRAAGLGGIITTHQDTLKQIDDLVDYALGAHDRITREVDGTEAKTAGGR
jgi:hypothetical protein